MIRTLFYTSMVLAGLLWPFVCESEPIPEIEPGVLCGDDAGVAEGKSATYSGLYQSDFEYSSFRISDRCEVWLDSKDNRPVKAFMTVEGVISPRGHYGHLGTWERELHVTKVLKFERIEK